MILYNKLGREIRPSFSLKKPMDNAEPIARISPREGIFAPAPFVEWAFAKEGEKFIENNGDFCLVFTAKENFDGARWTVPALALVPANWAIKFNQHGN